MDIGQMFKFHHFSIFCDNLAGEGIHEPFGRQQQRP